MPSIPIDVHRTAREFAANVGVFGIEAINLEGIQTMPEQEKIGWALLHSKLPPAALHPLPQSAYGVAGLTDVNEAYLIQRLFASGLSWEWRLLNQQYLGFEDR